MYLKIWFLLWWMATVGGDVEVKYVALIYRHGERTPIDPYPTDPYRNESIWPVEYGQLTNKGKAQHYALGKWLRDRYSYLLSKDYKSKEIYVRSTDMDRTIMSAQANLAGLYPPTVEATWNSKLAWQPIPIHTVPFTEDAILAMAKRCPAYDLEYQRMIESEEYQARLSQYQALMNYLTIYTGMQIKDYYDILDIYSTLSIEAINNLTLPIWTKAVFPKKMRGPACYSFVTQTGTPLLARLKVGLLLKTIVMDMYLATENTAEESNHLKMSMFSGHDLTIGNVLQAMSLFNQNCPDFTATIIMELLYDNATDIHYVKILYKNNTNIETPYVLRIPYCGNICPLQRFASVYENLISVDWERECKIQDPCSFKYYYPHVMGLSFLLSSMFIAINIYCFPRRRF